MPETRSPGTYAVPRNDEERRALLAARRKETRDLRKSARNRKKVHDAIADQRPEWEN